MKPDKHEAKLLLAYLLTPWCRVLLEKLTGLQLVKKFSAFYGTRRFITALTSLRHPSLSWASPIQSIYPHPTTCRSILILLLRTESNITNSGQNIGEPYPPNYYTRSIRTADQQTLRHILIKNGRR